MLLKRQVAVQTIALRLFWMPKAAVPMRKQVPFSHVAWQCIPNQKTTTSALQGFLISITWLLCLFSVFTTTRNWQEVLCSNFECSQPVDCEQLHLHVYVYVLQLNCNCNLFAPLLLQIMAALLLQHHCSNPDSPMLRNLKSQPSELAVGSGCTGTAALLG